MASRFVLHTGSHVLLCDVLLLLCCWNLAVSFGRKHLRSSKVQKGNKNQFSLALIRYVFACNPPFSFMFVPFDWRGTYINLLDWIWWLGVVLLESPPSRPTISCRALTILSHTIFFQIFLLLGHFLHSPPFSFSHLSWRYYYHHLFADWLTWDILHVFFLLGAIVAIGSFPTTTSYLRLTTHTLFFLSFETPLLFPLFVPGGQIVGDQKSSDICVFRFILFFSFIILSLSSLFTSF